MPKRTNEAWVFSENHPLAMQDVRYRYVIETTSNVTPNCKRLIKPGNGSGADRDSTILMACAPELYDMVEELATKPQTPELLQRAIALLNKAGGFND